MNRKGSLLFASALAFAATASLTGTAAAQDSRYQSWLAVNYQGPVALGGRLQLVGDAQYRAWDDFTPQAIIVRNSLYYRLMDGMFIGVGYMWQPAWNKAELVDFVDEHRIFETFQYTYTHADTGMQLQLRTRLEQRLRHPQSDVEFGLRARQLVRVLMPFALSRRLSVVAWDEVFINLTNSGHESAGVNAMGAQTFTPQWEYAGLDQNRAFLGLAFQAVPSLLRVELGYMNQYVHRVDKADIVGHTTLLQLFFNWR
ncbi:MAG: DUF2490 domain-containing protein [Polyangiales bacterium]